MSPSIEKVFANDLEDYILELSKKAIYNILDQEAFDLYLEKKWFPSQLNGIKSDIYFNYGIRKPLKFIFIKV